jgi:hypothetical protein
VYRSIETAMWDDPWFAELPPNAKLLFIYLITNRRATACGVFEIQRRALVFETGLSGDAVKEAIGALSDKVTWWADHQIIWVHNFYRRQRANTGPSFTVSARQSLATFPVDVQETVITAYPDLHPDAIDPSPQPPKGKTTHVSPKTHPNGRVEGGYAEGSDTHPTSVTVTETEELTETGAEERVSRENAPDAAGAANTLTRSTKPLKSRKTPLPDPFHVTEAMFAWAESRGYGEEFVRASTEYFVNWAEAHDHRYVDWIAVWRNVLESRAKEHGGKFVQLRRA